MYMCNKIDVEFSKRNATIFNLVESLSRTFLYISTGTILGELMFLNDATLLNNVKKRYYKNKIYVSILIFVQLKFTMRFYFFRLTLPIS